MTTQTAPIESDELISQFNDLLSSHLAEPYRGEIWENCLRFKLIGAGYKALYESCPEQEGHFWLSSARHLAGPLKALRDPAVRKVFIIGATQCLKSIVGDIWVPYVMEHEPRAMLVLFEDDPKAKLFCASRLMTTLEKHPEIAKLIAQVDRHDATRTKIILSTMMLHAGGLNEGNVSTLSWPNIWISEAWQHYSDGLLVKAIKRADRFPDTCKILIESQPGEAGEDLHRECAKAHRVDLTWECPFCRGRQSWVTHNEFGELRSEDFVPRLVEGQRVPTAGTYSGMKWDAEEKVVEGSTKTLSLEARSNSAWWECYHCGSAIRDTRANRQGIMDSYEQDYQITAENGQKFSPSEVAFFLPYESARDNRFAKTVATYLSAKEAKRMGDSIPLRDWYLQERAVFYTDSVAKIVTPIVTSSVNITGAIPDEMCRVLAADAQQDDALTALTGKSKTGHFWVVIRAIDKFGNMFQLWRGYCKSWDELIAVQDRFEVSNENFGIDASFFTQDITEMAAEKIRSYTRRVKRHGKWRDETIWHTWTLLKGDDHGSWKHTDGMYRSYSPMQSQLRKVTLLGQVVEIKVPLFLWSNLNIKDQLASLLTGGEGKAKFTALPRAHLDESVRIKEVGDFTYENQVSAEAKMSKSNGKPHWEKLRRHNHYWDAEAMALVLFGLGGFLGVAAAAES